MRDALTALGFGRHLETAAEEHEAALADRRATAIQALAAARTLRDQARPKVQRRLATAQAKARELEVKLAEAHGELRAAWGALGDVDGQFHAAERRFERVMYETVPPEVEEMRRRLDAAIQRTRHADVIAGQRRCCRCPSRPSAGGIRPSCGVSRRSPLRRGPTWTLPESLMASAPMFERVD
ncbi:MAG: hypothetical protein R2745_03680 [Vicinamibacterales bacterium]